MSGTEYLRGIKLFNSDNNAMDVALLMTSVKQMELRHGEFKSFDEGHMTSDWPETTLHTDYLIF